MDTLTSKFQLDLWGRLRSTTTRRILAFDQVFDNAPLKVDTSLTGNGTATWSSAIASTNMTCTTANGDRVIRQTKQYAEYQTGEAHLVAISTVMGAAKANVRQRVGIFDASNGLFFEQTATGISVVRRSNTSGTPTDVPVAQASWNLDPLDGTGASGITLDTSKSQVFIIDYVWQGMAAIRFGFLFKGQIVYCHRMDAANTLTTVYMSSPVLPLRWELTNTGATASSTTMVQTCGGVFGESVQDSLPGIVISAANTTGRTVGNGASVPILSVQLTSGFNRATLYPLDFSAMTTTGR